MRSIVSRLAIAVMVGVLAGTAIAPASAATRHKRAPAQADVINRPVTVPPSQWNVPSVFPQNECVSDEGYGRYSVCDAGGS